MIGLGSPLVSPRFSLIVYITEDCCAVVHKRDKRSNPKANKHYFLVFFRAKFSCYWRHVNFTGKSRNLLVFHVQGGKRIFSVTMITLRPPLVSSSARAGRSRARSAMEKWHKGDFLLDYRVYQKFLAWKKTRESWLKFYNNNALFYHSNATIREKLIISFTIIFFSYCIDSEI